MTPTLDLSSSPLCPMTPSLSVRNDSIRGVQEPTAASEEKTDCQPVLTDEGAFLGQVFGTDGENWQYFLRALTRRYPYLVERRREGGTRQTSSRSHIGALKKHRAYEVSVGSCDAEDILMDALTRCTAHPAARSFYTNYQPMYAGKAVSFRTWFMSHLRSRAQSRNKQQRFTVDASVDLLPSRGASRPTGVFSASSHAYTSLESQLDLERLSTCLSETEKHILRVFLDYGTASKAFAAAIGYEYDKARDKMSSIRKKMRRALIKRV